MAKRRVKKPLETAAQVASKKAAGLQGAPRRAVARAANRAGNRVPVAARQAMNSRLTGKAASLPLNKITGMANKVAGKVASKVKPPPLPAAALSGTTKVVGKAAPGLLRKAGGKLMGKIGPVGAVIAGAELGTAAGKPLQAQELIAKNQDEYDTNNYMEDMSTGQTWNPQNQKIGFRERMIGTKPDQGVLEATGNALKSSLNIVGGALDRGFTSRMEEGLFGEAKAKTNKPVMQVGPGGSRIIGTQGIGRASRGTQSVERTQSGQMYADLATALEGMSPEKRQETWNNMDPEMRGNLQKMYTMMSEQGLTQDQAIAGLTGKPMPGGEVPLPGQLQTEGGGVQPTQPAIPEAARYNDVRFEIGKTFGPGEQRWGSNLRKGTGEEGGLGNIDPRLDQGVHRGVISSGTAGEVQTPYGNMPARVRLPDGTVLDARRSTEDMYKIAQLGAGDPETNPERHAALRQMYQDIRSGMTMDDMMNMRRAEIAQGAGGLSGDQYNQYINRLREGRRTQIQQQFGVGPAAEGEAAQEAAMAQVPGGGGGLPQGPGGQPMPGMDRLPNVGARPAAMAAGGITPQQQRYRQNIDRLRVIRGLNSRDTQARADAREALARLEAGGNEDLDWRRRGLEASTRVREAQGKLAPARMANMRAAMAERGRMTRAEQQTEAKNARAFYKDAADRRAAYLERTEGVIDEKDPEWLEINADLAKAKERMDALTQKPKQASKKKPAKKKSKKA